MKLLPIYRSLPLLQKFVLHALLLGVAWYFFFFLIRYFSFIDPLYEGITAWLTDTLLHAAQFFLKIGGEDSLIYKKSLQQIGGNGIYLDRGCLGRNLMGLFAGFLVAFPGRIDTKLWFIPMGLGLVFLINILRIVALYLTNKYYPQYMDINHHTVFKYSVYALTFLLWYIWITRLRKREVPAEITDS